MIYAERAIYLRHDMPLRGVISCSPSANISYRALRDISYCLPKANGISYEHSEYIVFTKETQTSFINWKSRSKNAMKPIIGSKSFIKPIQWIKKHI